MQNIKKIGLQWLLIITLLIVISTKSSDVNAKKPKYYICIVNKTSNTVKYLVDWCTQSGENCTGYKLYSLPSGYKNEHWGPEGNKRMDVRIHTGGGHGMYIDYSLEGTADNCQNKSTAFIRYNRRGYLRLYAYKK